MTKRDIQTRYRGSLLGLGWSLLGPLLMLGVFTLVFHGLFQLRWPVAAAGDAQVDFALQVFVGLLLFSFFAEVASRAPQLIVGQPNLVTRVVFPLPLLGLSAVAAAGFQLLVGGLLLLVFASVLVGPQLSWLALPLVLLPFTLFLVALAWVLSSLSVYVRDVGQMMAMLTTLMMFLSGVFYPLETLPERWQWLFLLNPLARVIQDVRQLLFEGAWPDWHRLALFTLSGLLACLLAAAWFQRLRKGFADVL
nr:ABC transporter permease [Halochromatium roseum]